MVIKNIIASFGAVCLISLTGYSQCPVGEAEVSMLVHTDDYGYEGYWEIIPQGNGCGNGTIASGGNTAVGCNGAGNQAQTPGGYGNNITSNEGPWCLPIGTCFDLFFADDWGDGGFNFDILVNGFQIETFEGSGIGGTYTFCVQEPENYDLAVFATNLNSYVSVGAQNLSASVFNHGMTTANSYDLKYSVNGGAAQTHNVVGSSLANYQEESIAHSIPVNLPTVGNYVIKIWADNINGNPDGDNSNDTLTAYMEAGLPIPNIIDDYVNAAHSINQVAGASNQILSPTDLDFHPILTNNELWVCNKGSEASGGSTVTIYDAGTPSQTTLYKQDGNAWHFMSLPTGIAFSPNGNWASSPGVYDANHDGGAAFTGPSLWSSDMTIYGEPSGGNGSHLDMLHLSPFSQGIAAEKDNVFWVFDGNSDDIVRYDFAEDHGPGNSYHGDAIVRRYSDDAVQRDNTNTVVSHLELDDNLQWLYVVDHGNQRVIRIDITTGSDMGGAPNYPMNEPVAEYTEYTGYTQETVVTGLSQPSGIDIIGDRMLVGEHDSGEIIIYDISSMPAVELDRISTELNSVQGIKIGPDGLIWFVDQNSNGVYKVEYGGAGLTDLAINFSVYPNPSSGEVNIQLNNEIEGSIEVVDLQGKLIFSKTISGQSNSMNIDALPGIYFINIVQNETVLSTKKVVIR